MLGKGCNWPGVLPVWGSGTLSGSVQWGSRPLPLCPVTPYSAPCAYGSEDSRQCRGAGQRGGEKGAAGGNQEAPALLTAHPQPSACSVPGCMAFWFSHTSYCLQRRAAVGIPIVQMRKLRLGEEQILGLQDHQDLSPHSASSCFLTFFQAALCIPAPSNPLMPGSNHRCHLFPPS